MGKNGFSKIVLEKLGSPENRDLTHLSSVRSITFNLNYDVITLNYDQSELRSIT